MRSPFRIAPAAALLAAVLAAAACDSPSDSGRGAADVEALTGDAQQGAAGAQLAAPLVARVTDSRDRPVSGQAVLFTVLSGGGTLSVAQAATGAAGTAETRWTLGTTAGQEQRVEARVVDRGGATLAADTFTATAVAGAPARVVKWAGDAQTATAFTAVADSIAVRVEDANGNAVTGAAVTWAVTAGGGSVSPATSTSGAGGIARARWTLGAAGAQGATASVAGGTALAFTATATRAAPARVVKVAGDAQSAIPGTFVADSLAVRVEDANGNPVAGAQVFWTVASGGGTVNPNTTATDASGVTRTRWLLGTSGTQSVTAAAALGGSAATFTATFAPSPDVSYGPAFSAGPRQTCALTTGGRMYCWGRGYRRQRDEPTPIASVALAEVTTGFNHVCARTAAGSAYCMGTGLEGELGNGIVTGDGSPDELVAVQGGLAFTQLSAGDNHTCGITADGAAYCWGLNSQGQLGTTFTDPCPGTGAGMCSTVPRAVAGGHTFTRLDSYANTTCGVTAGAGRVLCWGFPYGATPVEVGAGRVYTQVAVGFDHVCALSGTQVYCRGANSYGQLGTGGTNQENAFVPVVGGNAFAQVVAGQHYTCGLTTGGAALCWGRNSEGVLGSGALTSDPRPTPTPVSGGLTFTAISGGQAHACGRAADGRLYCWGNDSFGQVGDGTVGGIRPQPTRVIRQL